MISKESLKRHGYNLNTAYEAVFINKFRSILTALGIIFGVAAVIAMMAIGNGAQQEILEQMKMVGVNNIVISPVADLSYQTDGSGEGDAGGEGNESAVSPTKFSPGLSMMDVESIREIIPGIERISPEVVYTAYVIKDGVRRSAKFSGVVPDFFEVFGLELQEGKFFNEHQVKNGARVCVIGPEVKSRFFKTENPLNKMIKCGGIWLKVIGVLKSRMVSETATKDLGVSEFSNTIFTPINTLLLRYKDRSQVQPDNGEDSFMFFGDFAMSSSADQDALQSHQLDKIIVQMNNSDYLSETAAIINRMLLRRHNDKKDFEVKVPELLLKQEQRTKDIFNIVLGAIASISLIVGGIGIMNIMLASVMERIREIGVRMAIGARRSDIVFQFIAEATIISVSGGFIGIILGVVLARLITQFAGILTIVSPMSIFISFGVSATVGIVFGLMPARKASRQDPVTSLRHD
jgi:putative ABC transport system permease protein